MSHRLPRRMLASAGLALLLLSSPAARSDPANIQSDVDAGTLKTAKTTPLGLYLTPAAAHRALTETPEVLFIDVRDPVEITFVGHAEGTDKIIPLGLTTHEVNPKTGQYRMTANDDFIADVDAFVAKQGKTKTDPIFLSCRSGARSGLAARKLIDSGYTNVWNLVEGFEGDRAPDGTRALNGWRNAGLPWGYKLAPGVAWED